jgi:hypothetical protein
MSSQADSAAIPGRYDVRKAHPAKAADLAGALARAFYDDPLFAWLLPDSSRRLAIARRGFELYLRRVWLRHEETYTVETSAGVCVWEPPDTWKLAVREQLSLLPAMLRIFGRNLPRLLGTLNAVEKNHPTALRHRCGARLSRGERAAQQGAVRTPRLRGHRGDPPGSERAAHVADVARSALTPRPSARKQYAQPARRTSRCKSVEDLSDVSFDQEVARVLHPYRVGSRNAASARSYGILASG